MGISIEKKRDLESKNQFVGYISLSDYETVKEYFASRTKRSVSTKLNSENANYDYNEMGTFYLIQLEPEHDPKRYKVGFASNIQERLRFFKCSAPFSKVIKLWPCKRLWEKTAIDCVTINSERLYTEVFRANDLDEIVKMVDKFFQIMPNLNDRKICDAKQALGAPEKYRRSKE